MYARPQIIVGAANFPHPFWKSRGGSLIVKAIPWAKSQVSHTETKTPLVVTFNPDVFLDKIRENEAQRAQTALRTPSPHPLSLHQRIPQDLLLLSSTDKGYREPMPNWNQEKRAPSKYNGLFADQSLPRMHSCIGVNHLGYKSDTRGQKCSGKTG